MSALKPCRPLTCEKNMPVITINALRLCALDLARQTHCLTKVGIGCGLVAPSGRNLGGGIPLQPDNPHAKGMEAMQRRRLMLASLAAGCLSLGTTACRQADPPMKRIGWPDLFPPGWPPEKYFGAFRREEVGDDWSEDEPRALAVLQRLKALSRQVPTAPAWEGLRVEIPGFAVMYGDDKLLLDRFFLAPYQGACVHRPPPPGNQLVHVRMAQPIPLLHAAYPLLMRGRLQRMDTDHPTAFSRYALLDAQYEHFDTRLHPDWLPAYPHL